MKKLAFLIVLAGLFFAGCKTQQKATTDNYDDVYYSKPKAAQTPNTVAGTTQDLSAPKYVTPSDSSTTVKAGSATTKEDNSDYSYSARLKHFHDPAGNLGYNDPYYSSQSADSNGVNNTVNVYAGSGWDPSFSMSFGLGFGYGYGYGGWGYPYYGWGYPYYGYYPYDYWGYGYGCGCCGYYPYYGYGYPYGYGYGGYYYGRRTTTSSHDGSGSANQRTAAQSSTASQDRNYNGTPGGTAPRGSVNPAYTRTGESARVSGNGTTNGTNTGPSTRNVTPAPKPLVDRTPADQQRYSYKKTNGQKSPIAQRTSNTNRTTQAQHATPRYVKPEYSSPTRSGQAQIYSSPAYRQPKSSQEYISPRNQDVQGSGNNSGRSYSSPSSNVRRAGSGTPRTYSSPSNNSRGSYTAPARSFSGYSSPARSGGSYSAPSHSGGGSYSAPARSSGGSGGGSGGSSGGGGGGGGHRR